MLATSSRPLRANWRLVASVRFLSVPTSIPVPDKTKVYSSADEAVKDIKSGSVVLSGGRFLLTIHLALGQCHSPLGFGLCGTPGVHIAVVSWLTSNMY